jgi:hypothetical protein
MRVLLNKREDDFSVQYSLPSSSTFWLRVEKPFDRLKITDLMFTDEEAASAIEALSEVYKGLGDDRPREITLTNILPTVQRSAAAEVPPIYDRLVKVVQASLPGIHARKLEPRLELTGTKFDISFRLRK